MRTPVVTLALVLLLSVSACGNDDEPASGERTSVTDLAATLVEVGDDPSQAYTQAEAECIAGILYGSELSDDALAGIAKGVPGFEKSEKDDEIYRALVPNISACLTGSLPQPSPTG